MDRRQGKDPGDRHQVDILVHRRDTAVAEREEHVVVVVIDLPGLGNGSGMQFGCHVVVLGDHPHHPHGQAGVQSGVHVTVDGLELGLRDRSRHWE
jgi:hypothetical protein